MRVPLYVASILLFAFPACTNSTFIEANETKKVTEVKEVTMTYENGDIQQERVYPDQASAPMTYQLLQYNRDGTVEMVGNVVEGKEEGTFTWYYPNGNKKWVETYLLGKSVDTTFCYYESGKLQRKVLPPVDSIRKATEFYETGEVKIITYLYNSKL